MNESNGNRRGTSRRDFLRVSSLTSLSLALGCAREFEPTDLSMSKSIDESESLVPIKVIENLWITLLDGRRLAARVWLPTNADTVPVPAVLEYLPYRKRDLNRVRDDYVHQYTAKHGYACLRVDLCGTGDSDGVLDDEYSPQEHSDGLEVLEWIANQSWCTGSVGMRGISWGGFNSLQLASMAPPQLKAIIPHCASDDRYTDDAHYIGGAISRANWDWGQMFMAFLSLPPDPDIKATTWKKEWLKRLENLKPVAHNWLQHQTRDEYWQYGSVREDYSKIQCPVYAVGGFVDSYTNAVPRLLEQLKVPCKGFIGPNGHQFPDQADPGPAVGFLHEEIRWWDHWLKGVDTGIMDEPKLQFYMPDKVAGQVYPEPTPGRWAAEHEWPSKRIVEEKYFMNSKRLSKEAGETIPVKLAPDQSTGRNIPHYLPFNMAADLPKDQAGDDARSLVFESDVLTKDIEILGLPTVNLVYSADQKVAKASIRLNEVLPDETSWNITSGILNLTHRKSHEYPEPLVPGERYETPIKLNMIAHKFKTGSRIRVAISESNWPVVWPSPKPVNLTVYSGDSFLLLPVRPEGSDELENMSYTEPHVNEEAGLTSLEPGNFETKTTGPDELGNISNVISSQGGAFRLSDIGTEARIQNLWTSVINPADPNSARWQGYFSIELKRGAWDILVRSDYRLTSNEENFFIETKIVALDHEQIVFEKDWKTTIERKLM